MVTRLTEIDNYDFQLEKGGHVIFFKEERKGV